MKVTVRFGDTNVVVPVGDGQGVFVKDLIDAAVVRYKKAANKGDDSRIRVHSLRIANECGGILDPDDSLLDVVEDKEQIVAIYDEQEPSTSATISNGGGEKSNGHHHHRATSSESMTTPKSDSRIYVQQQQPPSINAIPARFRASREKRTTQFVLPPSEENSVLVGGDQQQQSSSGSNLLVVRRGSEPVLNAPEFVDEQQPNHQNATTPKVGGAVKKRVEFLNAEIKPKHHDETPTESRFVRTAARKSRLTDEWLEVAAQAAEDYRSKKHDDARDGDDRWEEEKEDAYDTISLRIHPPTNDGNRSTRELFEFDPDYEIVEEKRQLKALIVRRAPTAEENLRPNDAIVEMSGRSIADMNFERAVEQFGHLCNRGQPFVCIIRRRSSSVPSTPEQYQPPDPVFPGVTSTKTVSSSSPKSPEPSTKLTTRTKSPSTTSASSTTPMAALQKGNTRRIGQRIQIELRKKPPPDGFGFTLTSRDYEFSSASLNSSETGEALVYIKNINATGAAIEDGRLHAGDRLLEVNGKRLDKTFGQPQVVQLLRQVQPGDAVNFVVSRQTDVTTTTGEKNQQESPTEKRTTPVLPRPLKVDDDSPAAVEITEGRSSYDQMMLTFDIPLNDSGSAGLGVSVKGRMAPGGENDQQRQDGGIFVKTILHGGAVHKDARLRVNDRVVAVDGVDLRGLSNAEAMQRLRAIMMDLKPSALVIHLTVLRAVPVVDDDEDGGGVGGKQHRLLVNENSNKAVLRYGDEDYATVVKNPRKQPPMITIGNNFVGPWANSEDDEPPVMMEWSDTAATASSAHRQQQHMTASRSDSTGSSWTTERMSRRDLDEEAAAGSCEALFVRDAPTRRSMSEKRHGASKIDPSSTATFQRIQHQRQTSAPALQRRPMGVGGSMINSSPTKYDTKTKAQSHSPPANADRRSLSLESVKNATTMAPPPQANGKKPKSSEKPLLHEEVALSLQKSTTTHRASTNSNGGGVKWLKSKSAANRQRPTNESFRQAVDRSFVQEGGVEVGVDVDSMPAYTEILEPSTPEHPAEPHYAQIAHSVTSDSIHASTASRSRSINKEKDRRKSTGSGLLKNLFRFGSGGKANRPFAVVSPVNNNGGSSTTKSTEEDENDYELYGKVGGGRKDRHKSQDRAAADERIYIHHHHHQDDANIEHFDADKTKYQSSTGQKMERQKQLDAQAIARKQHDEEQWRIRQHYERMKGQQQQGQLIAIGVPVGSNSPSPSYHHPKIVAAAAAVGQWKPPLLPTSSPPQSRTMASRQQHPVMGREMAAHIQHGRQHSGDGRLPSPSGGGGGHYYSSRQAVGYYPQGPEAYLAHQYHPGQAAAHIYGGSIYGEQQQVAANPRHRGTPTNINNNNNHSPKPTPSPPQHPSSWFVDGVGGSASARHHRFYYSSTDGRPSERVPTSSKTNGTHHQQQHQASSSVSQLPSNNNNASGVRARSSNERGDNWSTANASMLKGQGAASIDDGTPPICWSRTSGHQRSNGRSPQPPVHRPSHDVQHRDRVCSPDRSRAPAAGASTEHRVIIGSIPTFDSRRNDGVTRIIIDTNGGGGGGQQQPPLPPPDYEQYLRSRCGGEKKSSMLKSMSGGIVVDQARPCSEFIEASMLSSSNKYESSSLPRKGVSAKINEKIDAIMNTPPARDVHYFYHPQQQRLK